MRRQRNDDDAACVHCDTHTGTDDADNWNAAGIRAFVWGNVDGRGDDIFRLTGTRDLVNEFDPGVGPHS